MAIGGEDAGLATVRRRVPKEGAALGARCLPPVVGAAVPSSLRSNVWIVPRRPDRGLSVTSKPKDEFGDRLGYKRAHRIGELLLLVDKPARIPRCAACEPEPVWKRLQPASLPQ